jgi:hypothetical protein
LLHLSVCYALSYFSFRVNYFQDLLTKLPNVHDSRIGIFWRGVSLGYRFVPLIHDLNQFYIYIVRFGPLQYYVTVCTTSRHCRRCYYGCPLHAGCYSVQRQGASRRCYLAWMDGFAEILFRHVSKQSRRNITFYCQVSQS